MRLTKKTYLQGFTVVVLLLAAVRWFFPQVAQSSNVERVVWNENSTMADSTLHLTRSTLHKIRSVPSYTEAFPDTNAVQLVAAQKWGVSPVKNREDAESRKRELVYIGSNPYFHVDPLYSSIPYLVPRAAVLLQDIGQAFFDSLYVKGVPMHKLIVTSVLRSEEDVVKLRRRNGNATEKSCH